MPKLKTDYAVALDGVTVQYFRAGEEVTGEVAERAKRAGKIQSPGKQKQAQPVTENKAIEPETEDKSDPLQE